MTTIYRRAYDDRYEALREKSKANNEQNDCSVVALAAVCGVSYEEARNALGQLGRKDRNGTSCDVIERAVGLLGGRTELMFPSDFIKDYPGRHWRLKNVTTHHPDRFHEVWADGHNYLFYTRGHVGAVINGANVDWTRGRAKHVTGIIRVTMP